MQLLRFNHLKGATAFLRQSGGCRLPAFSLIQPCLLMTPTLFTLAEVHDDLIDLGFQLLAISPDRPEKLREKPDYAKISYTLLSDASMEAAKAFGIAFEVDADTLKKYRGYGIDLEKASGKSHHLLPHPAVIVVDEKGILRFVHVNQNYRTRLDPEKILAAAREVVQ